MATLAPLRVPQQRLPADLPPWRPARSAAPDRRPTTRPAPPPPRRSHLRRDIEGLRAVAVILVVLDHAGVGWFGGGFIGVDVFFVISGFLITSQLLTGALLRGRVSIGAFYARRVRRILPLAALVTVVVMFATYGVSVARGNRVAGDGAWTALFLGNVHFARTGTDYFSRGVQTSPLEHFWSLGVEEQFYLLWPVLLLGLAWAAASRWRRSLIVAILAGACVVSFGWALHQSALSPTAAYFSPFTRAWELGLGALVALGWGRAPASRRVLALRAATRRRGVELAAAGLVLIALGVAVVGPTTPFPGWAALLPTVGAALVIIGGTQPVGERPDPGRVGRALRSRPMVFVGQRSYGLYLWHFPLLVLPAAVAGRPALEVSDALGWMLVAFALTCVTYVLVEEPARHSAWLRGQRARVSLGVGLALVLVVLAASVFLRAAHSVDATHPDPTLQFSSPELSLAKGPLR